MIIAVVTGLSRLGYSQLMASPVTQLVNQCLVLECSVIKCFVLGFFSLYLWGVALLSPRSRSTIIICYLCEILKVTPTPLNNGTTLRIDRKNALCFYHLINTTNSPSLFATHYHHSYFKTSQSPSTFRCPVLLF